MFCILDRVEKGGVWMKYQRFGDKVVMTLAIGDEIMASLATLAEQETINAAEVTGIGAVDKVNLAFYRLATKDYEYIHLEEEFEVLSIVGNLTLNQGKFHPHLHIVLGREDLSAIGGHLVEAYTSVTMEIVVNIINGTIERQPDAEVKLDLMDLG